MVVDAGHPGPTGFPLSGITATMDGGTGLGGNTWYQIGQNPAAPTTGLDESGHAEGLAGDL